MNKPLLLIAFLGLLVSGYLFVTYVSPIPIVCGPSGGCHTVQASQYASHFGLPTPAYGMLYYFALGIMASLWNKDNTRVLFPLIVFTTGTGLAVSAYLTYLEAFVVQAWCTWCVVSAMLATAAFLYIWLHPKMRNNS